MKRVWLALGIAGALLALGLGAFIAFFPKDAAIAALERQIETTTGRSVTIEGEVGLTIFPALGLSAERVALSNPSGFPQGDFIAGRNAAFAVSVLPLLRGAIEVKRLTLDDALIDLRATAEGAANWTFPAAQAESQQQNELKALRLENVRLRNGRVRFTGDSGEPIELTAIDAGVTLDSLDEPARIAAAFDYRGQRIDLTAEIAAPRAALNQGETPITLQARAPVIAASLTGAVDTAAGAVSGQIDARGDSLRALMAWMGAPLPEGDQFGPFSIAGALTAADGAAAIAGGTYRLDAIAATGDVGLRSAAQDRLTATGALRIAALDLNPYLPAPTQANAGAEGGVSVGTAWSAAPLDLAGLRAIDADFALDLGALTFQRMRFSDAQLRLQIAAGALDATLSRVSFYGGGGTARLRVDARNATPAVAIDLDAQNIQALPLLTAAIGFDKIEGRGRLRAALAGQGASQAAIMRSLDGTMAFTFNDGAWRGVNLARVARMVQAALSGSEVGPDSATDFAEFAATFAVTNGAAQTTDLRMLNPFVRLEGQGAIDIGAQTIDMKITPRAVRSAQGQGGALDAAGLGVPFRISGPWTQPRYRPELGDLVRDRARSAIQDRLGGALGQRTGEQARPNPLGDLLQRR
ncbi:MAG: AsmA family protein [Hyphomonadaceae bacterium]|nr:AsmA family protein [Hyphomonadaceae bacterium]